MKHIFCLLLCALLLLPALTACAAPSQPEQGQSGPVVGGWQPPDSPVVPEDVAALLDQALEELVGSDYEPVALLGTQVVAGTNYRLLCKCSPVTPDAIQTYALVTLYADLEGNARITDIADSGVETNTSDLAGGWQDAPSPDLTDELTQLFEQGMKTQSGADYAPLALLSTQVVAGTNYRFLCQTGAPAPDDQTSYAFVTLYADLEGGVEVLDVTPWNSGT